MPNRPSLRENGSPAVARRKNVNEWMPERGLFEAWKNSSNRGCGAHHTFAASDSRVDRANVASYPAGSRSCHAFPMARYRVLNSSGLTSRGFESRMSTCLGECRVRRARSLHQIARNPVWRSGNMPLREAVVLLAMTSGPAWSARSWKVGQDASSGSSGETRWRIAGRAAADEGGAL